MSALSWLDDLAGRGGASLDTTNSTLVQTNTELTTADATPTPAGATFDLPLDSITTVDVQATCIQSGAGAAKMFSARRHIRNDGGTVTGAPKQELSGPDTEGLALGSTIGIEFTGTTGRVEVTGVVATALRWRVDTQRVRLTAVAVAGAVPAAPTAISPTSGAAGGGTVVTITVPTSVGLTGAKVGGVALTSFTAPTSTTVVGTTGAHAAGASDVVTTNAVGDSLPLVGAFTYSSAFTIESLSHTVLHLSSYAGAPWAGTASAGTSGTRTLTAGTGTPDVGVAQNGFTPADFVPANTDFFVGDTASNVFTAAAGSIWVLFRADAAAAAGAGPYADAALVALGGTGAIGMAYTTNGITAFGHDGAAYVQAPDVAAATAAYLIAQMKWDGVTLKCRVGSGAWVSIAFLGPFTLAAALRVGANFDATAVHDGRILALGCSNTVFTDANFADIVTKLTSTYAL